MYITKKVLLSLLITATLLIQANGREIFFYLRGKIWIFDPCCFRARQKIDQILIRRTEKSFSLYKQFMIFPSENRKMLKFKETLFHFISQDSKHSLQKALKIFFWLCSKSSTQAENYRKTYIHAHTYNNHVNIAVYTALYWTECI